VLLALAWQDHLIVLVYLLSMIVLGGWLARRQTSEDEYFLAGRRMPWLAVGLSVIASLLSSLTYLSEPGEVWKSGFNHMTGKMLAIPFEMAFVWLICIPFLMRFRLTSAYEYLEMRFGVVARWLGVGLFLAMVICWMGFVVLASARALSDATEMSLTTVILTMGVVATIYTFLGGLRAVIWTDVIQVVLLVGGAVFAIAFVAWKTSSTPPLWYETLTTEASLQQLQWFSLNPLTRATIMTVAIHMFVWHICTHTANQMTVQRYLSTSDVKSARRSFVTGSLMGVVINLLLMTLGLAIFYYYHQYPALVPEGVDLARGVGTDRIFPLFIVEQLPPGSAGAILVALLAAAMSSIDSGVNSVATVLTVQWHRHEAHHIEDHPNRASEAASTESPSTTSPSAANPSGEQRHTSPSDVLPPPKQRVWFARVITLVVGIFTTLAAFGLDELTRLTPEANIIELMPKSFNCFTGSMGGLFLVGIFLRRSGQFAVVTGTLCGLTFAIAWAFSRELFGLETPLSFIWVMPGSLLVTLGTSALVSLFRGRSALDMRNERPGLTWYTRHATPPAGA
jgi:SSS family solute:Na+ symporter